MDAKDSAVWETARIRAEHKWQRPCLVWFDLAEQLILVETNEGKIVERHLPGHLSDVGAK